MLEITAEGLELQMAIYPKLSAASVVKMWATVGAPDATLSILAVRIISRCAECGEVAPITDCIDCDRQLCAAHMFVDGMCAQCYFVRRYHL